MNALEELERFQTDRKLHEKPFDKTVCTMNIVEELFELHGVNDSDTRILARYITDRIELITRDLKDGFTIDGCTYEEPTVEDEVDALCDIQVFAGGDINKLGYSNEKCLLEVGKEINSRTGEIIDGKFQKYKTPEAMAKWYKADFSSCKM